MEDAASVEGARPANVSKPNGNGANRGFEGKLWAAAGTMRNNMDAAEYKHVVLRLAFLKYISRGFKNLHAGLGAEQAEGANSDDPDEYRAHDVFTVPPESRWQHVTAQAQKVTTGRVVDDAMAGIERDNPSLKGDRRKINAPLALPRLALSP